MPARTRCYTITEAAELSGLAATTLRYYETIGIIPPIDRASSGHRTYSQADLDLIDGIACLAATGMPIPAMREYLAHRTQGAAGAAQERELLQQQHDALELEAHRVRLRQEYVRLKIAYWRAVEDGDEEAAAEIADRSRLAGTAVRRAADAPGS